MEGVGQRRRRAARIDLGRQPEWLTLTWTTPVALRACNALDGFGCRGRAGLRGPTDEHPRERRSPIGKRSRGLPACRTAIPLPLLARRARVRRDGHRTRAVRLRITGRDAEKASASQGRTADGSASGWAN